MKKCDSSDNFSNSFDYIIYLNDTNKNDESITEIESNSSDNKSEDENIEDENDYMIYDELSENESIKTIPIPIKKPTVAFALACCFKKLSLYLAKA